MTQSPGSPGPYGPPGPQGPYAQQPAPPSYPSAPSAQPPVPKRRNPGLIVLVVVLGLALVGGAVWVLGRVVNPTITAPTISLGAQTSATSTPTPTPTPSPMPSYGVKFTLEGDVLRGPTFTARMPAGWTLADTNGDKNEGSIVKDRAFINYFGLTTDTAEARCTKIIESYHTRYGGTVETLTGHWGRRETVTKHLIAPGTENREVSMLATCVDRPGGQAALMLSGTDTDHIQVATDLVSLLNSWEWV